MTIFNVDEIWCIGLWSRVYASHQILGQSDLQSSGQSSSNFDPTLIPDDWPTNKMLVPFYSFQNCLPISTITHTSKNFIKHIF